MSFIQWDRHAAVEHLRRKAHSHSDVISKRYVPRHCARYVREAIAAGGVTLAQTLHAKDYGGPLTSAGFTTAAANGPDCVGDVVVLPAIDGHVHGHMTMFDGAHWISDFVQSDMWSGNGYRQARPNFVRYRLRAELPRQHRRKFTNMNVKRTVLSPGTRLFKFTEWELRADRPSEWWALTDGHPHLGAAGYTALMTAARADPAGIGAFVRRHFAVMLDWNGLAHRQSGLLRVQFARLICAVEALHGTCARVRQPRAVGDDPRPDIEYPGTCHQVFLPQVGNRELAGHGIGFVT